jgi:hypothetical protein
MRGGKKKKKKREKYIKPYKKKSRSIGRYTVCVQIIIPYMHHGYSVDIRKKKKKKERIYTFFFYTVKKRSNHMIFR